ncbi:hypothetical protein SCHPADRAFT_55300 [Schizopora paradoxa]|uniref:Uncharacterized protein n=1 Tax=Schizopora paradoxa TaxID=27342 RepID=A0A0H2S646_9AGAM|nr:hypothetical protein SCHPADRAFT_55300 [Schizopora paradoxa]
MSAPGPPMITEAFVLNSRFDPSAPEPCDTFEEEEGFCIVQPGIGTTEIETFGPTHIHSKQQSTTATSPVSTVSPTTLTTTSHSSSSTTVEQSATSTNGTSSSRSTSISSVLPSAISVAPSEVSLTSFNSSTILATKTANTTTNSKSTTSPIVKAPFASLTQSSDPKPASLLDNKSAAAGVFASIILGVILFVVLLLILWRTYVRSRRRREHRVCPYNVGETETPKGSQGTSGLLETEPNSDARKSAAESRILLIGHRESAEETDSIRVFSSSSLGGNPPPYTPSELGRQEFVDHKTIKE